MVLYLVASTSGLKNRIIFLPFPIVIITTKAYVFLQIMQNHKFLHNMTCSSENDTESEVIALYA